MSFPFNNRILTNANYIVSASIPSSVNNTGSTPSIDLLQPTPFPTTDMIDFQVSATQLIGTSGSLSYYYTFEDSTNNITFNAIRQCAPMIGAADNAGTSSAKNDVYKMPPSLRRYIRITASGSNQVVSTNGVTGSFSLTLLF